MISTQFTSYIGQKVKKINSVGFRNVVFYHVYKAKDVRNGRYIDFK